MTSESDTGATRFETTRDELFERLVLAVPSGYVVTEGAHGPGRKYHVTVGDLLDALREFCDEKEAVRTVREPKPKFDGGQIHG